MINSSKLLCLLMGAFLAAAAQANILPENNLHLEKSNKAANITEAEFNDALQKTREIFEPIVDQLGAKLEVNNNWTNDTVNAYARQVPSSEGWTYSIDMFGGLAKRPEITLDGFLMVICHEMGHHLSGYYFKHHAVAAEGQSDYYAVQACSRLFWKSETEANAAAAANAPDFVTSKCRDAWQTPADQNLCARVVLAGRSLAELFASLEGGEVKYDSPSTETVEETNVSHPRAQCRLDTYVAGAMCDAEFDSSRIPGKAAEGEGSNDEDAEVEAAGVTCMLRSQYVKGVRPSCWFKPLSEG